MWGLRLRPGARNGRKPRENGRGSRQVLEMTPFEGGGHGRKRMPRLKCSVNLSRRIAILETAMLHKPDDQTRDFSRRTPSAGEATTLAALVSAYIREVRPRILRHRDRFRDLTSPDDAVHHAAASARADGKREAHQRRIPEAALNQFATALLRQPIANARDFGDLFAYVRRAAKPIHGKRVQGIGDLAIYDVALRLGWFGRMEPKCVYLHAGTRVGAAALGLDATGDTLPVDVFPSEMQVLSAAEIEDFLCIYKARLARFRIRRGATSE